MNNEAQFGVRFAVKNAKQVQKQMDAINAKLKQMGVTAQQTGKKLEENSKDAEQAGKKQERTFESGSKKANEMSKSLDRVVKKWLSIGGAVTLVATIIRRAFAKVDEITGLRAMATSAGVAASRIESLGKKLREYGGDASSASSAYTSLGDILGGARSGRGISQDVVTASSRYGIALNGGMLTEDQLMTNIAKAMQVQRKRGNMYGVRDIASAFGIDEAMMLHLSQAGANWDRGLPAANLAKKQADAAKAKALQIKLENFLDEFTAQIIPILIPALQGLVDVINWIKSKFNVPSEPTKYGITQNGIRTEVDKLPNGKWKVNGREYAAKDAVEAYKMDKQQHPTISKGERDAKAIASARDWAKYYNEHMGEVGVSRSITNLQNMLAGTGATAQAIPYATGLKIEIVDKAGVLRNTQITASSNEFGSVSVNTATSAK